MNRFQRYVFTQVLTAVSMAVGLFVFVFMAGILLKEVLPHLSSGIIGFGQFFEMLLLAIPSSLPYTLPMGILTGVLIVLGRMSAQNEILAMKSSGLSLWRIVSPVFFLAILGVILSAYINFYQAPLAIDSLKRIVKTTARSDPSRLIAPGEFVRLKEYTIYVGERKNNDFQDLRVWQFNKDGQAFRIIHAENATLEFDAARDIIKLEARNARIERRNEKNPSDFTKPGQTFYSAKLPVEVPIDALLKGLDRYEKKLRYCALGELLELRDEGRNPKDNDKSPPTDPKKRFENRIAAQFQIQSSLANAFGILSLTMLAIPLGIKTSRSETLANAGIAIALALIFYVLTIAPSWLKDPAWRPDLLVWLPNLIFQSLGTILLWRASKN
jgi:lipopolysaccharide export system permease protein